MVDTNAIYKQWLAAEELARQREVVSARNYEDGAIVISRLAPVKALNLSLTDLMRRRANIIKPIVSSLTERMSLLGMDAASAEAQIWLADVWKRNRLDIRQDMIHKGAVNEGESFVLVDWNKDEGRVDLLPHPRYTSPSLGWNATEGDDIRVLQNMTKAAAADAAYLASGDGYGCKLFHENDDENQPAIRASKRWRARAANGDLIQRLTEYYPDRIEKYVVSNDQLKPVLDDGDTEWPLPWLDKQGNPLGIPVIHFSEPEMRPYALDAFGTQDDIVQVIFDMRGASHFSAYRVFYAFGWYPTTDGKEPKADKSNWLSVEPGQIFGNATKGPGEASFGAINGESLKPFIDTIRELIYYAAITTDTPLYRFNSSGQIAAADTLKQQDEPLIVKVIKRQLRYGNSWTQVFDMARRVQNAFGSQAAPEGELTPKWKPAREMSDGERIARALTLQKLRVPDEQVWIEAGYTQEQIDGFQKMASYQARQGLIQQGLNAGQTPAGG
ncbi:MAG: phage portal protein [Anaerolineae bacterium]